MIQRKYRIAWQSRITGKRGYGSYVDYPLAKAWLKDIEKVYGASISHWLQQVVLPVKEGA